MTQREPVKQKESAKSTKTLSERQSQNWLARFQSKNWPNQPSENTPAHMNTSYPNIKMGLLTHVRRTITWSVLPCGDIGSDRRTDHTVSSLLHNYAYSPCALRAILCETFALCNKYVCCRLFWRETVVSHSLSLILEPRKSHKGRSTTKSTKWHVRPVWSESSQCALRIAENSMILHANSEDSDQTGRMHRLICVFVGRKGHFDGFVMLRLIRYEYTRIDFILFCFFVQEANICIRLGVWMIRSSISEI